MTSLSWYYRLFGEEFGPVPRSTIEQLLETGTLGDSDEVRPESSSRWTTLREAFAPVKAEAPIDNLLDSLAEAPEAIDAGVIEAGPSATRTATDEWYMQVLGQDLGPISFEDLTKHAASGELSADAQVKLGKTGVWRRVGSIGKLMAAMPFVKTERTISPKPSVVEADTDEDDDDADQFTLRDLPARKKRKKSRRDRESRSRRDDYRDHTPPYGMPAGNFGYPGTPAYGMPIMGAAGWNAAPVVDTSWYAWIGGQEYGPLDLNQLAQWLQAGQVTANDYVRLGKTGQYALVTSYASLTSYLPPTPPEAPAPKPTPVVSSTATVAKPVEIPKPVVETKPVESKSAEIKAVATKPAEARTSDASIVTRPKSSPETAVVAETPVASQWNSSSPSASGGFGGGGGSGASSSFGGGASSSFNKPVARPVARPTASKKKEKVARERPEWIDDLVEKIKSPQGAAAAGLLGLVVLIYGWQYLPASTGADRTTQAKLEQILNKVRELRDKKAPPGEWDALSAQADKDFPKEFVDNLKMTASSKVRYKQMHLFAIRDRLKKVLQDSRQKPSAAEREFESYVRQAGSMLGTKSTLPPPPPTPPEPTAPGSAHAPAGAHSGK